MKTSRRRLRPAILALAFAASASPAFAQTVGGDLGGFIQEILANCAVEIAFAPKELRLANELSERLGYATVRSPSRSRPTGLSRGHRSVSESEQRRALLLPQELTQLSDDQLIVLKAGLPPLRGRKIRYYREAAFHNRVRPAPQVTALRAQTPSTPEGPPPPPPPLADPLTLDAIAPVLAAEGLEPLPPEGATAAEVEAWVERFIDATAHVPDREARNA